MTSCTSLEVKALSFDYQDKPLLNNLNFSLNRGQILHLSGGNGAGKTTLLRLLAGLLRAEKGTISFEGCNIQHDLGSYQKTISYIGHKQGFASQLTVRENYLSISLKNKHHINEHLARLSLDALMDKPCAHLSAGQKKRVGLIRLLTSESSLWLLDEPFNALDQKGIQVLMDLMHQHLKHNGLIVLTSHQPLPPHALNIMEYAL